MRKWNYEFAHDVITELLKALLYKFPMHKGGLFFVSRRFASRIHEISDLKKGSRAQCVFLPCGVRVRPPSRVQWYPKTAPSRVQCVFFCFFFFPGAYTTPSKRETKKKPPLTTWYRYSIWAHTSKMRFSGCSHALVSAHSTGMTFVQASLNNIPLEWPGGIARRCDTSTVLHALCDLSSSS